MYIQRHAEAAIRELAGMFGAVLVTGARQVGKTTVIQRTMPLLPVVTLDDPFLLETAQENGAVFLADHPAPVFIDEVQYAPALFRYLKIELDKEKKKGRYFLSGSQQFEMMKGVTESLAGRIGIQILTGLSLRERTGISCAQEFLPTKSYLDIREKEHVTISHNDLWEMLWRGSMPELCADPSFDWGRFYGSYVRTYIERDVRALTQVGDERTFLTFMTACAARTGGLLNYSELARDTGVSVATAKRWCSILETSNIIYLLQPYHRNIEKRMIRTPKLYFLDTGLAAYLTRWTTPDTLRHGAMSGSLFETFVVGEIIKSYYNKGILDLPVYFYRDPHGLEIDLIIETDGVLYPVEIKKHAAPKKEDIAAFKALDGIKGVQHGAGCVISLYDRMASYDEQNRAVPVWML